MKILFIGEHDGIHGLLAREMRRSGDQVTLIAPGGDLTLPDANGFFGRYKLLYRIMQLLPDMKGYDRVQLARTEFFGLKPGRLSYLLRELKRNNGHVSLTLGSPDCFMVEAAVKEDLFRFSAYRVGKEKTSAVRMFPDMEYGPMMRESRDFARYLYSQVDSAVAMRPEDAIASGKALGEKMVSVPMPVVASSTRSRDGGKVRLISGGSPDVMVGCGRDILRRVAKEVEKRCPDVCEAVDCMPEEAFQTGGSAIFLADFYSYSPSADALRAMSGGIAVVSGNQPEYADFVQAEIPVPVITAAPGMEEALTEQLGGLVNDREAVIRLGEDSRNFVMRHHPLERVLELFRSI